MEKFIKKGKRYVKRVNLEVMNYSKSYYKKKFKDKKKVDNKEENR